MVAKESTTLIQDSPQHVRTLQEEGIFCTVDSQLAKVASGFCNEAVNLLQRQVMDRDLLRVQHHTQTSTTCLSSALLLSKTITKVVPNTDLYHKYF